MIVRGATVLTMEEEGEVLRDVDILIEDGRIARVAPEIAPGKHAVLDARGLVAVPGFVQTHTHLCQTLFRNQADDLSLLEWLRERIWPFEAAHDESSIEASAELGLAELLLGGTTTILDMGTVRHTDVIFQAARRAGIRAWIGKCHMDVDAGQPRALFEDAKTSLAEADEICRRWNGAEGGRLGYAFAPRFVISCTEGLLRDVHALACETSALVHTHASESLEECRLVRQRTGKDNVEYLHSIGLTRAGLVLAHCVHVTDDEITLLTESRTGVSHCPSSNLKLASGIARVDEMLAAGVSVGLGADGAPCNNNLDMFREMRLAALIHKPRLGPRALPASRVLEMATVDGALSLACPTAFGRLAPGNAADIALLDLDSDVSTVPGDDLAARIVYSAGRECVRHVIVDGRIVVRDRRLLTLDVERARARAVEEIAKVRRRIA